MERTSLLRFARETLQDVAAKVRRYQGKGIGEQNTKASLIEPVLEALGWDIRDFEEVHREYKAKPQDRPVDYALKLLRQARLFIEATCASGSPTSWS